MRPQRGMYDDPSLEESESTSTIRSVEIGLRDGHFQAGLRSFLQRSIDFMIRFGRSDVFDYAGSGYSVTVSRGAV